jgi:hypothetical protein
MKKCGRVLLLGKPLRDAHLVGLSKEQEPALLHVLHGFMVIRS